MANNHSELEERLWGAADELRANSKLKSSEYSVPVLGLIFLRYADHKFGLAEKALAKAVAVAGRLGRPTIRHRVFSTSRFPGSGICLPCWAKRVRASMMYGRLSRRMNRIGPKARLICSHNCRSDIAAACLAFSAGDMLASGHFGRKPDDTSLTGSSFERGVLP
jgi:HsdM N-terminal domain